MESLETPMSTMIPTANKDTWFLSFCIAYFSIAVPKPCDQGNLKKKEWFGLTVPEG